LFSFLFCFLFPSTCLSSSSCRSRGCCC
jgi:hypothetical protein